MIMGFSRSRDPRGQFRAAFSFAVSNALCALLISYCLVSFAAGKNGLIAYGELKRDIGAMERRIAELESERVNLEVRAEALQSDPDMIAREARAIGFIRPGEAIVTISDSSGSRLQTAGHPLEKIRAGLSSGLPDSFVKLIALLTALVVSMLSFAIRPMAEKPERLRQPAKAAAR